MDEVKRITGRPRECWMDEVKRIKKGLESVGWMRGK